MILNPTAEFIPHPRHLTLHENQSIPGRQATQMQESSSGPIRVSSGSSKDIAAFLSRLRKIQAQLLAGGSADFPEITCSKQFALRFRRTCGISLHKFLTQIRIETAETLLQTTEESPSQVARRVGYESYASFRIHFKVKTLCSPSNYRREIQIVSTRRS